MKQILHLTICVICGIILSGYSNLNKYQKEIADSKCIIAGCYFGMIFYNNKAQIDTYCSSQIEPPKHSGVFESIELFELLNEINPKGKIR